MGTPQELTYQISMNDDELSQFCYRNRLDVSAVMDWIVKYSIRGIMLSDGSDVLTVLQEYPVLHLTTNQGESFTFEAWLSSPADRDSLFNALKPLVDQYGEYIDWHECTHNNAYASRPCVIAETYVRGRVWHTISKLTVWMMLFIMPRQGI